MVKHTIILCSKIYIIGPTNLNNPTPNYSLPCKLLATAEHAFTKLTRPFCVVLVFRTSMFSLICNPPDICFLTEDIFSLRFFQFSDKRMVTTETPPSYVIERTNMMGLLLVLASHHTPNTVDSLVQIKDTFD